MKKGLYLFFSAFLISFFLHLLIVIKIYHPGNMLVMPITIGMVFGWLYTSGIIKDYLDGTKSSFSKVLQITPAVLKYILGFTLLYSIFNFLYTFSVQYGEGWVDFGLDHNKLRGISGFWLLFYMIGFTGAFLKYYIFPSTGKKE